MTFRSALLFAVAIGGLALLPASAFAGSCPVCTTSADCVPFDDGGVAFCVLHDAPVGCGSLQQLCCPGQGCNTFSGRPSCEGTTCHVVDGDGGVLPDSGLPMTDAGPGHDAGTASMDGSSGLDAGMTTTRRGGCCSVGGAARLRAPAGVVALAVVALAWTRRRARR